MPPPPRRVARYKKATGTDRLVAALVGSWQDASIIGLEEAKLRWIFFVGPFARLPLGRPGRTGRVRDGGGLRLSQRRDCLLRRAQDRKPLPIQQGEEFFPLRGRPVQPDLNKPRAPLPCPLPAFSFTLGSEEVGGRWSPRRAVFRFHQDWWVAPILALPPRPSRDPGGTTGRSHLKPGFPRASDQRPTLIESTLRKPPSPTPPRRI